MRYGEYMNDCLMTLLAKGYEPIFITLRGSQNYGLDTKDSDHDYLAVVAPFYTSIARGITPVTKEIKVKDGICVVKEIRTYLNELVKGNFNAIEALFSKETYVDNEYQWLWDKLSEYRNNLAYSNPDKIRKCLCGLLKSRLKKVVNKSEQAYKVQVLISYVWRFFSLYSRHTDFQNCIYVPRDITNKWRTGALWGWENTKIKVKDFIEYGEGVIKKIEAMELPVTEAFPAECLVSTLGYKAVRQFVLNC